MKVLFFISVFILLFSCTKFGKNVTVKDRVLNPITGIGLADIKLNLRRGTIGSFNGGYKTVKSTTTDANGYFEINKLGLNSYHFRAQTGVDFYDLGWFQNDENITGTGGMLNVKWGKTMHAEYRAVDYGNLVTPKTDPGDYIIEKTGDITVKARNSISIKPGFHTQAGSDFHAFIGYDGCSRLRE